MSHSHFYCEKRMRMLEENVRRLMAIIEEKNRVIEELKKK